MRASVFVLPPGIPASRQAVFDRLPASSSAIGRDYHSTLLPWVDYAARVDFGYFKIPALRHMTVSTSQ